MRFPTMAGWGCVGLAGMLLWLGARPLLAARPQTPGVIPVGITPPVIPPPPETGTADVPITVTVKPEDTDDPPALEDYVMVEGEVVDDSAGPGARSGNRPLGRRPATGFIPRPPHYESTIKPVFKLRREDRGKTLRLYLIGETKRLKVERRGPFDFPIPAS